VLKKLAVFVCTGFVLIVDMATAQPPRGLASLHVPEGFTVEIAAGPELSSYPMFMEFDEQGRLFIAESSGMDKSGKEMQAEPECMILMLEDVDGDGVFDRRTVYADKLSLPMGVLSYQGSIYTASPPDFIRLKDKDGDGVADEREVLLTGWNVLNTASLHGPFLGPDGWMYLTHGRHGYKIQTKEGQTLEGLASRIWRCKPDGTQLERFCGGGFDNPIEIAFTEAGELIGTMTYFTDPKNGQRDALMHWVEGGVYPKEHESLKEFDGQRTGDLLPPITKFARVAPSGFMRLRGDAFGAEYKDNFFSAQFNPHRVQRHIITRAGATFASQDSDFLTSTNPDFHPTDVIEDADGSMLVSDTGAWYVDACPVSRVAKPEIRGSIYRIRRLDAPKVDDPRGLKLAWKNASSAALAEQLSDPRPAVRDRAAWMLSERGEEAEEPLKGLLESDAESSTKIVALDSLGRMGKAEAALNLLNNTDTNVQIVAARWTGIAFARTDPQSASEEALQAFDGLAALATGHEIAARREAALALGHYGTRGAPMAILTALVNQEPDAFLEHAAIHGISISDSWGLQEMLAAPDASVRRAVLLAMDNHQQLSEESLVPLMDDADARVRDAAFAIAARHPLWSEALGKHIGRSLGDWSPERSASLLGALRAFAGDTRVMDAVATYMADTSRPERAAFMLNAVERSAFDPLPEIWLDAVATVLDSDSESLRSQAIRVIRTRDVTGLDAKLLALADDTQQPEALRLAALDAALAGLASLEDARLAQVISCLGVDRDPNVRQSAARLLSKAPLSPEQARVVATSLLPNADALTFGNLLAAVGKHVDEATGLALVEALGRAQYDINRIPPREIEALFSAYPDKVQQAAAPIRAKAAVLDEARLKRLAELTPKLGTGDVGRGRQIFFGEKVACSTCHTVGEEGGDLGPDLTTVGVVRSGGDLLEALLFPNASIVQGYESYQVKTFDGTLLGVLGEQTAEGLTLRTAADAETYVSTPDILAMEEYPLSLMPEGLEQGLSEEELLDLMAFLQSLNNEPWLLPEQRDTAKATQ
jgi:putative membrane-bound dehydrogenase-like protein